MTKKEDEIKLLKCVIIQFEHGTMGSIWKHMKDGKGCDNGCKENYVINDKRIHHIINKLHDRNITEYGVSSRVFWLVQGMTTQDIQIWMDR